VRPNALLIRDLVSRIERPWLLVADRLGLVGGTYVLRTRDGSAFEVRGAPVTASQFLRLRSVVTTSVW
jgi:hypothetical protein